MSRPKPPAETKAELMEQVTDMVADRYSIDCRTAMLHILNYFTALDLHGIRSDLQREAKR